MRDVKGFLGNKQSEGGPLASEWAALEESYDKRYEFDHILLHSILLCHKVESKNVQFA